MNALIPFRPFADILSFDRRFPAPFDGTAWIGFPRVDVKDTGARLELTAELPGVTPEQVEVTVENGVLTLHTKADQERASDGDGYVWRERRHQSFRRSFRLPQGTGAEQVAAAMENGLLTVTVAKAPVPQATRIAINGASPEGSATESAPAEAEAPAAS